VNVLARIREAFAGRCPVLRCPVCHGSFRRFLPLPASYEENLRRYGSRLTLDDAETLNLQDYSCPGCGASDRDRLISLFLAVRLPLAAEEGGACRVIEFAPSLPLSGFLRSLPRVCLRTADIAMEGVDDIVDISDMGRYSEGSFDVFVCSHVLEHVRDDRKALSELHRILRRGGVGVLMAPIFLSLAHVDEDPAALDEGERWCRFGQNDHVRAYSREGFLERVSNAGFRVDPLGIGHFGREVFLRHGITERSVLYAVSKA
jgi:SAM-dependent methyltransferase